MQFTQIFDNSVSVMVYRDGSSHEFYKGEEGYAKILNGWNELVCDAYDMPAFGVSLDKLTRQEMKSGNWVEFVYDGRCEFNEMPYEKLLVKVEDDYGGFNIIRYLSEGGYCGRCFYLQLNDKTMSQFNNVLKDIQF